MKNKKAFSVGEMMIVLLVISITLAASMPIITKRSRSSVDNTWHPAQNNVDAYFNTGNNNGVIIGGTQFPSAKARLMLNLATGSDASTSHIIFTNNNSLLAKLKVATNKLEFGSGAGATGDNSTTLGLSTTAAAYATAVGSNANANASNATAVGYNAEASTGSVAIGKDSQASANGIAIGSSIKATGNSSVAIGSTSTESKGLNSIAIGSNAQVLASGDYGIAIGYNSSASSNSVALGSSTSAENNYSVAIGPGSTTTATNQLNLGTYYNATNGISTINIGASGSTINMAGIAYSPSDLRKKNILGEYKSSLNDIMKIKTYEFIYKDDLNKNKRVGVIAQELQKTFPNAVTKDKKGYLMVRKEDMFFAIINAIKELNLKCIALEKENKQLKNEIESLSKRIEKLEQAK